MARQNFTVTENARVEIRACEDRVIVVGWDDAQTIVTDCDARQDGNTVFVEHQERVHVRVPRNASIVVAECESDVRVSDLTGRVEINSIEGDVTLHTVKQASVRNVSGDFIAKEVESLECAGTFEGDVALRTIENFKAENIEGDVSIGDAGNVAIETVEGDLSARGIRGALNLGNVEGDVSVRDLDGALIIERAGADFAASELRGAVNAQDIEGDAAVTFAQVAEMKLRADGDVVIRLPEDANVEIELDALRGDLMASGMVKVIEQNDSHLRGTLGNGGVKIQAESTRGDLVFNGGTPERGRHEHREHWQGEDWGGFGRRIAEEVRENVTRSLGNMRVEAHIGKRHHHRHERREQMQTAEPTTPARGPAEGTPERQAILDAISRGELSVDDAIKKLKGEV
jgi:hypothetical protein